MCELSLSQGISAVSLDPLSPYIRIGVLNS